MLPTAGLTVQVTVVFVVPLTVAVNCWVCPAWSATLVGVTLTEMLELELLIEMVDCPIFVGSAALTAATITEDGIELPPPDCLGAVYSPEEETDPRLEFPPTIPLTVQLTAVFVVPVTDAINC